MKFLGPTLIVALSLLSASCDRPAIDPSQSLVGAKRLPSARELARERIEIHLGYDEDLSDVLSYELRPDDSWTVRVSKAGSLNRSTSQRFQLSSADARAVREKLWRVRPDELKGILWVDQPADCPPPPTDTHTILSIIFVLEGPKPGIKDDQLGIFALPFTRDCNTPHGIAARALIEEVLRPLPGSNLRSKFSHYPPLP